MLEILAAYSCFDIESFDRYINAEADPPAGILGN